MRDISELIVRTLLLSITVLACVSCGPGESRFIESGPKAGWPKEFILGLFGSDDADAVLERHEPIRLFLEEQLGIPIRIYTGTSYTIVIEAMRAGRADGMMVGAFSYSVAAKEAGAEAIAVNVNSLKEPSVYEPNRKPYYYSYILVKKGSGLRRLEDLRGKDFLFVDPVSTSGHLFPRALLLENNINPDADLNTAFSNSHPVSILQVYNDRSPACATADYYITKAAKEGVVKFCMFPDGEMAVSRTQAELDAVYESCPQGNLVAIAQSKPIPRTPFAVSRSLPDSLKNAMREALLTIKDHPEIVAASKQWFVDPTDEQGLERLDQFYNTIREAATIIDLDLKEIEG